MALARESVRRSLFHAPHDDIDVSSSLAVAFLRRFGPLLPPHGVTTTPVVLLAQCTVTAAARRSHP
ncbi:MAG TPA: hypothetical protein VNN80_00860 [Polyangiaceae bacterium]|nr:hypothetical protein [Polyangiaceae bacterium]